MHSYLITGGTWENRQTWITERIKIWKIHAVDQVFLDIDEEHIGIDAVRLFKKRLQLAPLQSVQRLRKRVEGQ